MNFELFLGRFHPLIVHLPIGFLLMAVILELMSKFFKDKFTNLDPAISIIIFCGGIGAILSAILGYLISIGGSYENNLLFWHKWLGIGIGILSFVTWGIKKNYIKLFQGASLMALVLLSVTILVTGHLGGNLTHGSDYLFEYAPNFVKKVVGIKTGKELKSTIPRNLDSLVIFEHLVQPVIEEKCSRCHNQMKKNGGLLLTSKEGFLKGGNSGPIIVPGNAQESEIFLRNTLPQSNRKFMPPTGEPLTYNEIKVLEWWIKSGASFESSITQYKVPNEIETMLLKQFDVNLKLNAYYEIIQVSPLNDSIKNIMSSAGLLVKPLSNNNNFLQVKPTTSIVSESQIELLLRAKEQITWLNLSNKNITNDMLKTIGQLDNLTRLKLNNNPITDLGISYLKNLNHLEILNLYGSSVTEKSIVSLKELKGLKRLYIWQTEISEEGIRELNRELPDLDVFDGV